MWTIKYHKFLYIWMQAKKTNKQTIHILACEYHYKQVNWKLDDNKSHVRGSIFLC